MPDPIVVDTADPASTGLVCRVPQHSGNFVPRWAKPEITWAVLSPLPMLGAEAQRRATFLAWSYWAAVCGIRPIEVESAPLVVVTTARGQRNGMDGPGGVLAWAQLPGSSAWSKPLIVSFDLEERWTLAEPRDLVAGLIRYVAVAAHELGHTLGFDHSATGDLMQPLYSPTLDRPQRGDIRRARERYGPPLLSADVVPSTGAERLAEIEKLAAEIVRLASGR